MHKRAFKEEKRRHAVITFALKIFAEDIHNWRPAHQAIAYIRERAAHKKADDSLDSL